MSPRDPIVYYWPLRLRAVKYGMEPRVYTGVTGVRVIEPIFIPAALRLPLTSRYVPHVYTEFYGCRSHLMVPSNPFFDILVSGATQAGKTTLLNCLSASIGPRERVITVEEIFELKIPQRDMVNMQCRQPNLEGSGEISLRRLIKEALRMRPDRIIVGEVREAEALDMLVAMNAGLPGNV